MSPPFLSITSEPLPRAADFTIIHAKRICRREKTLVMQPLLNKNKLENAVLDQIQKHILSTDNVERYIELAIAANAQKQESSAQENAIRAAIAYVDAKLQRWEEALERGLLSLEDAAQRIKGLRQEKATLLKTQTNLDQRLRSRAKIRPIPTALMETYVKEIQRRLKEKALVARREISDGNC